jgi:hypothetical protein
MIKIRPGAQTVEFDKPQKLTRDQVAAILKVLDSRKQGWTRA